MVALCRGRARAASAGAARGPRPAESFGARAGLLHDVMSHWLMALDGAAHDRARSLVRREFTPRRVEALRPVVARAAALGLAS